MKRPGARHADRQGDLRFAGRPIDRRGRLRLFARGHVDRSCQAEGLEGPAVGLSQQRRHGRRQGQRWSAMRRSPFCARRRDIGGGSPEFHAGGTAASAGLARKAVTAAANGREAPRRTPQCPRSSASAGRVSSRSPRTASFGAASAPSFAAGAALPGGGPPGKVGGDRRLSLPARAPDELKTARD